MPASAPAAGLPVAEAARAAATADGVAYVPRPESADAARPRIILQTLNPQRTLNPKPLRTLIEWLLDLKPPEAVDVRKQQKLAAQARADAVAKVKAGPFRT